MAAPRPQSLSDVVKPAGRSARTVDEIVGQLRQEFAQRGARGIVGLSRRFRIMDDDGSKTLSLDEFKKAMAEVNMDLDDQQLRTLFNFFDRDGDGSVNFEELLSGIRGPMSDRRRRLVHMAFDVLDKDGNGVIEPHEIAECYDASQHPDVMAGRKTADEVFREFLDTFDVGGEVDGKVTEQEFINYYHNISASIDDDDYFELMIRNAWHISGGEGWAANSANRRVLVTHADGRQTVEEIKDDLGLAADDREGMAARLRRQGVDAASIDTVGAVEDGAEESKSAGVGVLSHAIAVRSSARSRVGNVPNRDIDVALKGGRMARPGGAAATSPPAAGGRAGLPAAPASRRRGSAPPPAASPEPHEMPSPGVSAVLARVKQRMRERGARGIVGLTRKFRIFDDDGSRTLSHGEFRKGMKELDLDLSEREIRHLFAHFDRNADGSVGLEEFLQGVRDPLSQRRLRLVRLAFSRIDRDGNGVIEPEELVDAYDTSRHPDVLAGRKSSEDVLREFMETFEVGETVDGKITEQEFINYYTNIGISIDNDDYFELMIRNAWHISGGEGWAANSANRRVLVTHADGRQTVEEIKDDLGLAADDREGMAARLRRQGVDASSISLTDAVDSTRSPKNPKPASLSARLSGKAPTPRADGGAEEAKSEARPSSSDGMKAALQGGNRARGAGASPARPSSSAGRQREPDAGLLQIIRRCKQEIRSRGGNGFIALQRKFRIIDDDGSRSLQLSEFKKAMREMQIDLSDRELRLLFSHFDADGSGSIDFEEFVQGLRDPMSDRRLHLVRLAFRKLDKDGSGTIEPHEIAECYDASQHPDVMAGRKTADEVFREFLDTFDVGGEVDGKVTEQEFINYYHNISASIDDDDYFELMIRNAWHISGGEGWAANSANRRVLVTHADGRQTVEEIKDDLGLAADDREGMAARLRRQGVDAASIDTVGAVEDEEPAVLPKPRLRSGRRLVGGAGRSSAEPGVMPGTGGPVRSRAPRLRRARQQAGAPQVVPPGIASIVARLKAELASRGARGFTGLQRKFRIMDDDGNRSLDRNEFKKAMEEMNIGLAAADLRRLFEHFDADGSDSIDFEEFVQGVRDPLSDRRLHLVKLAFHILDRDGNGVVDAAEVAEAYDASKHPEVIAGRMTPEEVCREFMETFEVGETVDGKITEQEFINYYHNISASIDFDDYFELMIRNAWHISGGEGWAANTANRRVLVTHADGRQTVEEIKDDLGLAADDREGMAARLRRQGVDAAAVDTRGGVEDEAEDVPGPGVIHSIGTAIKTSRPNIRGFSAGGRVGGARAAPDASSSAMASALSHQVRSPRRTGAASRGADAGTQSLLVRLKRALKRRGARGMIGLSRKFRIMDDDGDRMLSMAEFSKAMGEMDLGLSKKEVRILFEHFDADGGGDVSYEEFLQGVRDPLTERRLSLIRQAFHIIDADGNGCVEPHEIAAKYDASQHPEVIAGRMTPADVYREFLDTFDVGGEKDGKVTEQEFINYYHNISASIDDDDYFELMIRNAWHISGGEGWAANSANRRVLVTHADGRQTVEEIKDDLGLAADDREGMAARLRRQGVDAAAVDTRGGVGDEASAASFEDLKVTTAAGGRSQRSHGKRRARGSDTFRSSINLFGSDGDGAAGEAQPRRSDRRAQVSNISLASDPGLDAAAGVDATEAPRRQRPVSKSFASSITFG